MMQVPVYAFPSQAVAIDTESTGLWPWRGHRMFAASATFLNGEQLYWREDGYYFGATTLRHICENPDIDKVFTNAKHDMRMLKAAGIEVRGRVWDTMILCHLLDGRDAEGGLSLDAQARKYVPNEEGKIQQEIVDAFGAMGIKFSKKKRRADAESDAINFQDLPHDLLMRRNMGDSRLTMAIFKRVFNTVAVHFPFLLHQEHVLLPVVARMEERGVLIDPDEVNRQGEELSAIVDEVIDFCEGVLGESFRITAPRDQRALLEKAGIYEQITEWTKPKKNRKSTKPFVPQRKMDEYNLRSLHHPVAHMLLLGKAAKKLMSPFLTSALDLSVDNVLRASFRQCGTTSGRFSCSDPNLQNIPTEGDRKANLTEAEAQEAYEMTGHRLAPHIKRIFRVRPGFAHIHADKKQAEMVALAHYTGDPKLIEIFLRGESIHDGICKLMFGGEISKGLKQKSKSVTFGYQYGAGLPALAKKFNGDIEEATKMRAKLETTFVYLPQWKRDLEREISLRGYVTTLHGRRHYLRRNETYMAVNRVCQGTVGDEVKNRMVALDDAFRAEGMSKDITVLLNIHDDIATEVPAEMVPEWGPKIYRIMSEMSLPYRVPMPSSMDITYTTWADLKEVEKPDDPASYPPPPSVRA